MIEAIIAKIKSLLHDENLALSVHQPLVTSGLLNSVQIIELATWLETEYGIDFSNRPFDVYAFETIAAIQQLIDQQANSAAGQDT